MAGGRKGQGPALSSPEPPRRGAQELGALIPRLVRPAFRRRSPAAAQIMADWTEMLGPRLAPLAEPVKLVRGTLTLACTGPAAMELGLCAPVLIERINAHVGRAAVARLAFVQRSPAAAPPPARAPAAAPSRPLPAPVAGRLAAFPEGELKAALARLAEGVYRDGE
ncbi:MAG: DciA family protein [Roseococcus sp.]